MSQQCPEACAVLDAPAGPPSLPLLPGALSAWGTVVCHPALHVWLSRPRSMLCAGCYPWPTGSSVDPAWLLAQVRSVCVVLASIRLVPTLQTLGPHHGLQVPVTHL